MIEPFLRFSNLALGDQVFKVGLADPDSWTYLVKMSDLGINLYLNRPIKIYFEWPHRPEGGRAGSSITRRTGVAIRGSPSRCARPSSRR
jgi:hypothetical protein